MPSPMNFLARNTSLNDSLLRRFGILVYVFYRLYHVLEHSHPSPAPLPSPVWLSQYARRILQQMDSSRNGAVQEELCSLIKRPRLEPQ